MPDQQTLPARWPSERPQGVARVLFFGRVADCFGHSLDIALPAEGCSLGEVRARLSQSVDGGAEALAERGLRAAVDQELANDAVWVRPGQEIAFLSVFSGG